MWRALPRKMAPTKSSCLERVRKNAVDYETALHMTGYGWFSYRVLCASIASMFSVGVQSSISSFVLPAAKCDLDMSTNQLSLSIMAYMIGGVLSTFFWGITADVFGRRSTLLVAHALDSIITLLQSTSNNSAVFMLARATNGFLIGGPSNLIFIYVTELVGNKKRGLFLDITGICFTSAWVVLPLIGWFVIPLKGTTLPVYFTSWRLLLILFSIPGFVTTALVYFLPETPRFWLFTNKKRKALKELSKIYEANTKNPQWEYAVQDIELSSEENFQSASARRLIQIALQQLQSLVSKKYVKISLVVCFIVFANMAAGFGVGLMIPELLTRLHNGVENNSCLSQHNENLLVTDLDTYLETQVGCNDYIKDEVFHEALRMGAWCVAVGIAFSACTCTSVRTGAALCAAASCTGVILISAGYCNRNSTAAVWGAITLQAAAINGNVLLGRLILLVLPARLTALGVCMGMFAGRFGAVVSSILVGASLDYHCFLPFTVNAVLCAGSIVGILLLDTKQYPQISDTSRELSSKAAFEDKSEIEVYI